MLIPRVLALPHHQFHDAYDAAHSHPFFSTMLCLSTAEGEKPRPGGRLPLGAFALAAAVSIPGLRLELPAQCLAASVLLSCPSPSSSFRGGCFLGTRTRNPVMVITPLLWWYCQDAPVLACSRFLRNKHCKRI